eukprot:COSAG02_NODE_16581_length_1073_cov_1.003080_2_plen_45_part_01
MSPSTQCHRCFFQKKHTFTAFVPGENIANADVAASAVETNQRYAS